MQIQLKEKFSIAQEDGATQAFFGVDFVCKHKKIGTPDKPNQFIAEWFADVDDKDGQIMVDAQRADKVTKTANKKAE